jgi:hypothetical protein
VSNLIDTSNPDDLEVYALAMRLLAAMQRAHRWHAVFTAPGGRHRMTASVEMIVNQSGQPCGCDPGAGWTCERHRPESDR